MKLGFKMDGAKCNPPRNWKELQVELNFDSASPDAVVSTTNFEFVEDNADYINARLQSGLQGGVGIYEGIPFQIEVCDNNLVALNGCLNTASSDAEYTCDIVSVPVKESGRIDFLNDRADSFTFAYLASSSYVGAGSITLNDYKQIPYVVSSIPDYTQAMLVGMSVYVLAKEALEVVKEITGMITQFVGDTATDAIQVGTYSNTLAATIFRVALLLAYLGLIIISLIKLIQDLFDNIVQRKKHKLGMLAVDLCTKAAAYLGMNFYSPILQSYPYNKLCIIPQKIVNPVQGVFPATFLKDKDEAQSPQAAYGYYDGTFGDLLRQLSEVFDAEVRVVNNTIQFVRKTHFNNLAAYTLPNIKTSRVPYTTNADELPSNYFITWQLDGTDLNTYDEYGGTNCQMVITPNVVGIQGNVLLKNLTERRLPFAMGKRKETLTNIEDRLNGVINACSTVVNTIVNLVNNAANVFGSSLSLPTMPSNVFNNRIGWLKLSSDFIGIQKLVILDDDNKLSQSNRSYLDASQIFNDFHSHNMPTRGNQALIYKNREIPMCCEDFLKIKDNNKITTFDGRTARIDSLKWNVHKETATIDYRVYQNFTNNLNETLILDGR